MVVLLYHLSSGADGGGKPIVIENIIMLDGKVIDKESSCSRRYWITDINNFI